MDWKSPNDIMRTHRIKKTSSGANLRRNSSSPSISLRRHASEGSKAKNENIPLLNSYKDGHTNDKSNKRRNPFSSEAFGSPRKKRSVLNSRENDCVGSTMVAKDFQDESNGIEEINTPHVVSPTLSGRMLAELSPTSRGSKLIEQLELVNNGKTLCSSPPKETEITVKLKNEGEMQIEKMSKDSVSDFHSISKVQHESSILAATPEQDQKERTSSTPPVDWSLKTKLRVVSVAEGCGVVKRPGVDARHVHSFSHHQLEAGADWNQLDLQQRVRRCCFHYSYPQLPWMQAFPRTAVHFRSKASSVAAANEEIASALQRDWAAAFTSVYQQLRSAICPYFYLCAQAFTVLFRCQRSAGGVSWSALLSPSTRGLRELLSKEGILFTLPNVNDKKVNSHNGTSHSKQNKLEDKDNKPVEEDDVNDDDVVVSNSPVSKAKLKGSPTYSRGKGVAGAGDGQHTGHSEDVDDDHNDDEDNDNDDDGEEDGDVEDHQVASLWLEGMGLDKKDFPTLEPNKVKLQLDSFREIDNRATSMVYVEGPHVHPFFDFLLNYPGCFANSGPQFGIPPTILSPVPFVGGILTQNNVKLSLVKEKQGKDGDFNCLQVFEISGPILPHHTLNIASILRASLSEETNNDTTCSQSASVSYSTHTPSAAFNTHRSNDSASDSQTAGWHKLTVDLSSSNAGLLPDVKDSLTLQPILCGGEFVKDLNVLHDRYSWT